MRLEAKRSFVRHAPGNRFVHILSEEHCYRSHSQEPPRTLSKWSLVDNVQGKRECERGHYEAAS